MSVARRRIHKQHHDRRRAEHAARDHAATACRVIEQAGIPVAWLMRCLSAADRTFRRWRHALFGPARRGRPPHAASREERNAVFHFLRQRGAATPLAAVRAAFPEIRRRDLRDVLLRYRCIEERRAERFRSRLIWNQPGAVWAADFKERREPIEGRYGWILSIKDLASRCQLLWQPLVEASAAAVYAAYTHLFHRYGAPLVFKADNGGQFRADEIKALLAQFQVIPLFSPKRHPQYNGGIERANGQLTSYQEALAQFHRRPAGATCADAAGALVLANELSRPEGWLGPTAGELWEKREPIDEAQRATFLASVEHHRHQVRAAWEFADDGLLGHYEQAAIDRRAVRDSLVEHGLLEILPRRSRRAKKANKKNATSAYQSDILSTASEAATLGGTHVAVTDSSRREEANSSTNKTSASGQD